MLKKTVKKTATRKKAVKKTRKKVVTKKVRIDSDMDGLSDEQEKKIGTDPFKADTDGDGISDLAEVKIYHTDPLNPDTDGDGLSDGQEVQLGLNPLRKDKLKDLFIPHAGNDYAPHALHPKRTAFYAVSFVTAKLVVFVAMIFLPMQAFLSPDVLATQRDELAVLINHFRTEKNLSLLPNNIQLASSAKWKVGDMVEYSYFSHVGPFDHDFRYFLDKSGYDYDVAGENLAMGFVDADAVMQAWIDSPLHYQNLIDPSFVEMGLGIGDGKYKNFDTIYIANHFGRQYVSAVEDIQPILDNNQLVEDDESNPDVLGERVAQAQINNAVSESGVVYNKEDSQLFWRSDGRTTTLTAKAYIKGEVASATVSTNNLVIELNPSAEEKDLYVGVLTADQPIDEFFNVIITPAIKIETASGLQIIDSLSWFDIKIVTPTAAQKYVQAQKILPQIVGNLFLTEKIVYIMGLIFFAVALLINTVVEIKTQKPKIIIPTILIIILLAGLIII